MDKLTLMRNLKLLNEDTIQLLIKEIGSFALRVTAASLRLISLNQFLREMQHIITTTGDPPSKSPSMRSKFDKSKDKLFSGKSENKEENLSKVDKDCYYTYCHRGNHFKEDCFKLWKKKRNLLSLVKFHL